MDIRHHYVREFVQNQQLCVSYRPTSSMTADILTKPLDSKIFLSHRNSLFGTLVFGGCCSLSYIPSKKRIYII